MGTHPIFESDFDCLTDSYNRSQWQKEPRRSVSLVNTEPVTVLPWERSSRKWKFPNTKNTSHPSVVPPLSREPLSVSGPVPVPTKRSLVAHGSHIPRTTPSSPWVSDVSERMLNHKRIFHCKKVQKVIRSMIISLQ